MISKRLAMYTYEKRQIEIENLSACFCDIQSCESSSLHAKGKQPFYIYGFELLKTVL